MNENVSVIEKCVIDCDVKSSYYFGMTLEIHQKGGKVNFDINKLSWYVPKILKSKQPKGIGLKVMEEVYERKFLNANILDFLIENKDDLRSKIKNIIRNKRIFFWGDIYNKSGDQYVRYIYINGSGEISEHYHWFKGNWDKDDVVAYMKK